MTKYTYIFRFHYFLFEQVLAIAKKFVAFEGAVNCMYVVPVKEDNGYDIDWSVMTTHEEIAPVQPTSYEVYYSSCCFVCILFIY